MNEQALIYAINAEVRLTTVIGGHPPLAEKYPSWYIGITDDTDERKADHENKGKNVKAWKHWRADSEAVARSVEKHFQKLGMTGKPSGGKNPTYVYIY